MTTHDYVELLAPAGSDDSLRAAFRAGADAAYIGGTQFGARAYADNPDDEGLITAIDYAHLHGRRLYLTVNTLLKEKELEQELHSFLYPLYKHGLDAVLVQDFGVLSFIKERYPLLPVHISTQMTVAGIYGARLAASLGAERLVLPRELSLDEIKEIHDAADIELETFIHGALCYCYSGQCLMSSLIGGRSGNRGRCAQTCRMPVNGKMLMNMKDICTLDILPMIVSAGVSSLKIEGRMKGPRYTAGVVSVYRKYLDKIIGKRHGAIADGNIAKFSARDNWNVNPATGDNWTVDPADKDLLRELFDRGGFSKGYYLCHNGPEMIAMSGKPDRRIVDEEKLSCLDKYLEGEIEEPLRGKLVLRKGQSALLTAELANFTRGSAGRTFEVTIRGAEVQAAKSRPLTRSDVMKQMERTGGSGYRWESLDIDMEDGAFLPVSMLNALRREAFSGINKEICDAYRRND
ncbi:MAG: U32 family peptidase [Lachnospiraceae bacterium]|nr:U32 family peptidase [Lachnospiraceae bacterium]